MNFEKTIASLSKMLTSHARSIILISSLVLVGVLLYGFFLISELTLVSTVTFMWMYFIAAVISLGVVITVLYLANRDGY